MKKFISILFFASFCLSFSSFASTQFTFEDAPFIGGNIQVHHQDKSIRLICRELENETCKSINVVSIVQNKRSAIVLGNYTSEQIQLLGKIASKNLEYQDQWLLPTTASTSACGIPLFLPLTLPIDISFMPLTFWVAQARKVHAKNAIEILINTSRNDTIEIREANYQMIEEQLRIASYSIPN